MSDADKERIKYLATLLNKCAASCFTIGIAGAIAAALYGAPLQIAPKLFVVEALCWLSAAVSLQLAVRRILGRLR